MATGLTLYLPGENATKVAATLKDDISAMGYRSEIVDGRLAQRIGCAASRTLVCEVLIRNGVIVLVTTDTVPLPEHQAIVHVVSEADSTSVAAERVFQTLKDKGVVETIPTSLRKTAKTAIPQQPTHLGYVK